MYGAMAIIKGNGLSEQVQTLDNAIYISLHANILRKGMNPSLLSLAIDK